MATKFVDEVFEISIKDECALLTWPSGERRCVPIKILRIEHARVARALAEYDGREAEIVPFSRRD